jgi:hypothetical protein
MPSFYESKDSGFPDAFHIGQLLNGGKGADVDI